MNPARSRLEIIVGAVLCWVGIALVVATLDWLGAIDRGALVAVAALVLIPAAVLASLSAELRRRSDRIVAGGVAVLMLAIAVEIAFVLSAIVVGRLPDDADRWVLVPATTAAVITAVLFGPLRHHAVAVVHGLGRGGRRRPEDVVQAFGDRASRGVPDGELLLQLVEALKRSLHLQRAEVWVGGGGALDRMVSVPAARPDQVGAARLDAAALTALADSGVVGEAWLDLWLPGVLTAASGGEVRVAPASFAGDVLGVVVVERAPGAVRFTTDEDLSLAELGRRLGVVLHNRQLDATLQVTLHDLREANEELRASRSRLVAAADAERRRLERDLHDGAQQHLVALAVRARLARDLLVSDPEEAAHLLEELDAAVHESIDELRDLARGIYPPLLRDEGLRSALSSASSRHPQVVVFEGGGLVRYSSEVEAAVYFCCLEALQNAAKHAPASTISLRVTDASTELRFEVVDDGPGFDPDTVALGHGLRHMRDRVGAVGGAVSWSSSPGSGTRIEGSVALADPTRDRRP